MGAMSRFGAVSLGLTLASCQAIGSEQYLGEPLLQFHGQAIVDQPTGGVALRPALCFDGSDKKTQELNLDFIPKEALAGFEGLQLLDFQQPYVTIVDVESVGEFPSDFSVSAYLPPPRSAIKAQFKGEPRSATGAICAVREDHPDVSYMAYAMTNSTCTPEKAGPCNVSWLWARRDSEQYYAESYECPSRETKLEECELQKWGDEVVKRESYEGVLGFSEVSVVYLLDEAAPDSHFAWYYGATETLKPGFHLFQAVEGPNFDNIDCLLDATSRADEDVRSAFADHYDPSTGQLDPAYREAADELYARREAHYRQESSCRIASYRELSSDEALSIEIRSEAYPTADPRF